MISRLLGGSIIKSMVSHFTDKFGYTVNEPKIGSILYTGLLADFMEHTGIYIGDGKIIELNNKGHISVVTPSEFVNGGTGINIYVSAQNGYPVGSSLIAERAIKYEKEVSVKNYHLLFDNCHMFTSACIIDELDNANSFLWMVKDLAKDSLGADEWLVWKNYSRFDDGVTVVKKEPDIPTYTQEDLENTRRLFEECNEQCGEFWEELKAVLEKKRKLYNDAPHTWFFYSESKAERWQQRVDEIEQIEQVNQRKHDDLLIELGQLEDKIKEIKHYLER
ncbi:hypothetical protein I3271_06230 [Photobacterium leiognathi]|uniref:hypothetical protein n=1 Tax=Photobacterium leiognathi TaxID=553611 RepID=UPI001EE0A37A|nr:hypothetical protein [Photobacterium leiognathi]MCG3884280.1 hypothetical protein [Photobacterium leiognathi]